MHKTLQNLKLDNKISVLYPENVLVNVCTNNCVFPRYASGKV